MKKYKLKDVCRIEKGKIGITKAIPGEYPLVATAKERSSHNEWHFDEPATIVPLVSSTGHGHASIKRLHYEEGKYAVGNILVALIPKDNKFLSAKYLYVYLTAYKEKLLVSQMSGAANVTLTMTKLNDVEVEVPNIDQQLEIVNSFEKCEVFSKTLASQIGEREEYISLLRQQILHQAYSGVISDRWRKKNPNIESAKELLEKGRSEERSSIILQKRQISLPKIEDSEIPFEIPDTWTWCRLGEITNYGSSPKAEPSEIKDNTWVLDLEDIEKDTSKLLTKIEFKKRQSLSSKNRFERGDVLYSKLRPYLDKVIVADNAGVCTTEILPLKACVPMNPHYLMYALKRPDFLKYVNRNTKGMKMPRLSTSDGKKALIPLAPINEQDFIVKSLESVFLKLDRIMEINKQSEKNLDLLTKTILRGQFS